METKFFGLFVCVTGNFGVRKVQCYVCVQVRYLMDITNIPVRMCNKYIYIFFHCLYLFHHGKWLLITPTLDFCLT